MRLAALARERGVQFRYAEDGSVVTIGLERVDPELRREIILRIEDVRAVVREHTLPLHVSPSDVADAARKIVRTSSSSAFGSA